MSFQPSAQARQAEETRHHIEKRAGSIQHQVAVLDILVPMGQELEAEDKGPGTMQPGAVIGIMRTGIELDPEAAEAGAKTSDVRMRCSLLSPSEA